MLIPSFRQRRRIAITLTLFAFVVMFGIVWIQTGRLADVACIDGWNTSLLHTSAGVVRHAPSHTDPAIGQC